MKVQRPGALAIISKGASSECMHMAAANGEELGMRCRLPCALRCGSAVAPLHCAASYPQSMWCARKAATIVFNQDHLVVFIMRVN